MESKPSTLLKVVSILFIISGALVALFALLGLAAGSLTIVGGETAMGVVLILITVIGCLSGILQLIAGILGVRGRKLKACLTMAIIILVLSAISLISSISSSTDVSSLIASLSGIVLPVLYLIGVNQSQKG